MSRRTPTVKVAGWKALMVENLCMYQYGVRILGTYSVPCLRELTLAPPHERTVHVAHKAGPYPTCITKLNSLARYNHPSPEQAPSSVLCPPWHRVAITTSLVTSSTQVQLCRRCEIMSSSAKSFNSDFSLAYCIMYEYNTVFSRGGVEWVDSCSIWSEMFAEALLYVMPNCIHFLRYSLYLPILEWFHCSS